jgi:hypothetical protein
MSGCGVASLFVKACGSEYAYRRFGTPAGTPLLMPPQFRGNLDSGRMTGTSSLASGGWRRTR